MLYLDIQKVEEETKTAKFHKNIGAIEACAKIIIQDQKGHGKVY